MRRIKLGLLGMALLSLMTYKVEAKKLTVDEVVTEFNRQTADMVAKVSASVDNDNQKIKVNVSDKEILLSYTEDYLAYDSAGKIPTGDGATEALTYGSLYTLFLESAFSLSGLAKDYNAVAPSTSVTDFDKYNVVYTLSNYEYTSSDGGKETTNTGTYIKDFKIGFDTEKLAVYAAKYGEETDSKKYGNLVPDLTIRIADNIAKFHVSLDYTPKDEKDSPRCNVYRSYSLDGDYTKVGADDWSIDCLNSGDEYYQDGASEGKTVLYYKAQVIGSTKYSNIIKVDLVNKIITDTVTGEETSFDDTDDNPSDNIGKDDNSDTRDDNKTDDKTDEKKLQNPNTGDFLPFLPILILMLISIVTWRKVGNKFVRI